MTRLREFEQGSRNALHASLRVLADAYTGDPDGFYTRQAIPTTEGVVKRGKRGHHGNMRNKGGKGVSLQLNTLRDALAGLSVETVPPRVASPVIEDHTLEAAADK